MAKKFALFFYLGIMLTGIDDPSLALAEGLNVNVEQFQQAPPAVSLKDSFQGLMCEENGRPSKPIENAYLNHCRMLQQNLVAGSIPIYNAFSGVMAVFNVGKKMGHELLLSQQQLLSLPGDQSPESIKAREEFCSRKIFWDINNKSIQCLKTDELAQDHKDLKAMFTFKKLTGVINIINKLETDAVKLQITANPNTENFLATCKPSYQEMFQKPSCGNESKKLINTLFKSINQSQDILKANILNSTVISDLKESNPEILNSTIDQLDNFYNAFRNQFPNSRLTYDPSEQELDLLRENNEEIYNKIKGLKGRYISTTTFKEDHLNAETKLIINSLRGQNPIFNILNRASEKKHSQNQDVTIEDILTEIAIQEKTGVSEIPNVVAQYRENLHRIDLEGSEPHILTNLKVWSLASPVTSHLFIPTIAGVPIDTDSNDKTIESLDLFLADYNRLKKEKNPPFSNQALGEVMLKRAQAELSSTRCKQIESEIVELCRYADPETNMFAELSKIPIDFTELQSTFPEIITLSKNDKKFWGSKDSLSEEEKKDIKNKNFNEIFNKYACYGIQYNLDNSLIDESNISFQMIKPKNVIQTPTQDQLATFYQGPGGGGVGQSMLYGDNSGPSTSLTRFLEQYQDTVSINGQKLNQILDGVIFDPTYKKMKEASLAAAASSASSTTSQSTSSARPSSGFSTDPASLTSSQGNQNAPSGSSAKQSYQEISNKLDASLSAVNSNEQQLKNMEQRYQAELNKVATAGTNFNQQASALTGMVQLQNQIQQLFTQNQELTNKVSELSNQLAEKKREEEKAQNKNGQSNSDINANTLASAANQGSKASGPAGKTSSTSGPSPASNAGNSASANTTNSPAQASRSLNNQEGFQEKRYPLTVLSPGFRFNEISTAEQVQALNAIDPKNPPTLANILNYDVASKLEKIHGPGVYVVMSDDGNSYALYRPTYRSNHDGKPELDKMRPISDFMPLEEGIRGFNSTNSTEVQAKISRAPAQTPTNPEKLKEHRRLWQFEQAIQKTLDQQLFKKNKN